jgi:hypothetical protein
MEFLTVSSANFQLALKSGRWNDKDFIDSEMFSQVGSITSELTKPIEYANYTGFILLSDHYENLLAFSGTKMCLLPVALCPK